MDVKAPDLRTGFPRSGREMIGGIAWVGRMADKARAKEAGTLGDYISLCPLDYRFLRRCRISGKDFEALIKAGRSDDEIADYFNRRLTPDQREKVNKFILVDKAGSLHRQDSEEGR